MPEIVGIEPPDTADVAVRGTGRDGFSFGVLRPGLPGPLLLVVGGEFTCDILEGDVACEVDEVLDRRPLGFFPGGLLVWQFAELRVAGDFADTDLENF